MRRLVPCWTVTGPPLLRAWGLTSSPTRPSAHTPAQVRLQGLFSHCLHKLTPTVCVASASCQLMRGGAAGWGAAVAVACIHPQHMSVALAGGGGLNTLTGKATCTVSRTASGPAPTVLHCHAPCSLPTPWRCAGHAPPNVLYLQADQQLTTADAATPLTVSFFVSVRPTRSNSCHPQAVAVQAQSINSASCVCSDVTPASAPAVCRAAAAAIGGRHKQQPAASNPRCTGSSNSCSSTYSSSSSCGPSVPAALCCHHQLLWHAQHGQGVPAG